MIFFLHFPYRGKLGTLGKGQEQVRVTAFCGRGRDLLRLRPKTLTTLKTSKADFKCTINQGVDIQTEIMVLEEVDLLGKFLFEAIFIR